LGGTIEAVSQLAGIRGWLLMEKISADLERKKRIVARRRLPIGAEVLTDGGCNFRVWAPRCAVVEVVLEPANGAAKSAVPLERDEQGYFSGVLRDALAGRRYRFRLDGAEPLIPDPASRFQPEGPHGPSEIIDPATFEWHDGDWRGIELPGQVLYEMHIGTYTPEGTWAAAEQQLEELKDFGITVIEVMPINEFAGRFGWGYDGVDLYAPTRLYGRPDDFRRFVDRAHLLGLGVILDVVYNHMGPDGNYLGLFSADYFSIKHKTDWGEAINYDGNNCAPVREFFGANGPYWVDEYHVDGLRLDATQNIYDDSTPHILSEIAAGVRRAAGPRSTLIVAENEKQHAKLVRPVSAGGYGLDALWNDDFHHSARVALTGQREAYYLDYVGTPQELLSALKWGFLYQGQWYAWQKQHRGTPTRGLAPAAFINFLENHDQICNSGFGERIHYSSHPGCYRALTALLLLAPSTPLLFMGQEFGASSPFVFFADHKPELAKLVHQGRKDFVAQFASLATPESQAIIPNPADEKIFAACRLNLAERQTHQKIYQLHRDLLRLRREDPVFRAQGAHGFDGAVLMQSILVLRFFGAEGQGDRLLMINLGVDSACDPAPQPLLAPPENCNWKILWSSERPAYGGRGTPELQTNDSWRIQGYAATLLTSEP
jgi:maltooligosyltrehalose trehalohydrolase